MKKLFHVWLEKCLLTLIGRLRPCEKLFHIREYSTFGFTIYVFLTNIKNEMLQTAVKLRAPQQELLIISEFLRSVFVVYTYANIVQVNEFLTLSLNFTSRHFQIVYLKISTLYVFLKISRFFCKNDFEYIFKKVVNLQKAIINENKLFSHCKKQFKLKNKLQYWSYCELYYMII